MELIDYVVIGVIAVIVGLAALYVVRAKLSGRKCIGCPDSPTCNGNCASCSKREPEEREDN